MADSATLNHASRVLTTVSAELPADAALRRYLATSNRFGGREKRAISQAVFTYFRWLQWLDRKASFQKQVEEALGFQFRFDQNPNSIKVEALAARAVPAWLDQEVKIPADSLRQMQRMPALWLRARPGKTGALASSLHDYEAVAPKVAARYGLGVEGTGRGSATASAPPAKGAKVAAPVGSALTAIRYTGFQDLFLTPQFHNGEFEIQDLASQFVGYACAPQPGQTWWDACAGEGGKLLHLGDLMFNKGLIWASDRSERRLQQLKKRAARAKLFNFRTALWDGSPRLPTKTKFDGVLLDAPCSGVGTWQRNPHARWSAAMKDVKELAAVQRQMLESAAVSVKSGGRLVYSVCTLTKSETTEVVRAFSAAHPEWTPVPVFPNRLGGPQLKSPAFDVQDTDAFAETAVTLWPHDLNANGMFIATWQRK